MSNEINRKDTSVENLEEKIANYLYTVAAEKTNFAFLKEYNNNKKREEYPEYWYEVGQYFYNQGVCYEIVAKCFLKAAEMGHTEAQVKIAHMYLQGEYLDKNYNEAVKWFSEAAKVGHSDAQYNLGKLYFSGCGVEIDFPSATMHFKKAAENGHTEAQYRFGEMLWEGKGIQRDIIGAAEWFTKAAEAQNTAAVLKISHCYLNGEGVQQDKTLAYAYLSFYCMAEGADDEIKVLRHRLEDELSIAQRVQASVKANGLFEKARNLRGIN